MESNEEDKLINENKIETIIKKPNFVFLSLKRLFDIFSSSLAILMLLPIFMIFLPIVSIAMKGSPFFVQKRPGKNNKPFKLIKFRTMTNQKDAQGNLLPDDKRLTKFGEFLRNTSIDELPELFNIIKGDMSVVGPRPQLMRDLVFMNDQIKQRHMVKPGLTGLAQISGRNAIDWNQKFEYDLEYISKMSVVLDFKIILETIKKVLKSEDITQEGMATADDYGVYLVKCGKITEDEWKRVLNIND